MFNEDDDEFNGDFESLGNLLQQEFEKIQRLMFINDVEKHITKLEVIPVTPTEYELMFGEILYEDLQIMTKTLIKDMKGIKTYSQLKKTKVLNRWGEWIPYLLQKNVECEDYEKCIIIRDIMNEQTKKTGELN